MNTQEHSALGQEVKAARWDRNLTQVEVAVQIGVSERTVQNWEAGMTPKAKHRRAILAWLAGDLQARAA